MNKLFLAIFCLAIAGCASNGAKVAALRADAVQHASQYCAADKRLVHVISSSESQPLFLQGRFVKVVVRFNCTTGMIE